MEKKGLFNEIKILDLKEENLNKKEIEINIKENQLNIKWKK